MAAIRNSLQPHAFNGVLDAPGPGSSDGQGVWGNAPLLAAMVTDKSSYFHRREDFLNFNTVATTGDWTVTQATTGTALRGVSGQHGTLVLDSDSTTADQGIQAQNNIEAVTLASGKDVWFECRLKVIDTIDKVQLFAGLSLLDTTIMASGEISASDFIGFLVDATKQGGADAGKVDFEFDSTAGSAQRSANIKLLVEDTYVKLGFRLYWESTTCYVQPYVDDAPFGDPVEWTSPATAEALSVSFACLSEGTNDPIATVDWYEILVER